MPYDTTKSKRGHVKICLEAIRAGDIEIGFTDGPSQGDRLCALRIFDGTDDEIFATAQLIVDRWNAGESA